jgi:hypothetical protein
MGMMQELRRHGEGKAVFTSKKRTFGYQWRADMRARECLVCRHWLLWLWLLWLWCCGHWMLQKHILEGRRALRQMRAIVPSINSACGDFPSENVIGV